MARMGAMRLRTEVIQHSTGRTLAWNFGMGLWRNRRSRYDRGPIQIWLDIEMIEK